MQKQSTTPTKQEASIDNLKLTPEPKPATYTRQFL